jgi:regulator of PEP synthase PpsR (kinase-PPPase family)
MNMFFGMPSSATRPYWELAARIERGVDELAKLQSEGEIEEHLMIDSTMSETVDEILDSGTCSILDNLETRIDRMADLEIETEIRASPNEFV